MFRLAARSVRRLAVAPLALAAVSLAACDDDDDPVTPTPAAQVKVVHAIANAGAVSVLVDDTPVATGFTFPNVFPAAGASDPLYANVPEGSRRLRVNLGTGATAIDQTATLVAGTNYTVIAAGTAGGTGALAPAYILLTDNVAAPAAGQVRIRAVHAASAVGNVDIFAGAPAAPFNFARIFQNVPFRGNGSIEVPAGAYTVCVVGAGATPAADGSNCAIRVTTPALAAGTVATAIARDAATAGESPSLILTVDRRP